MEAKSLCLHWVDMQCILARNHVIYDDYSVGKIKGMCDMQSVLAGDGQANLSAVSEGDWQRLIGLVGHAKTQESLSVERGISLASNANWEGVTNGDYERSICLGNDADCKRTRVCNNGRVVDLACRTGVLGVQGCDRCCRVCLVKIGR